MYTQHQNDIVSSTLSLTISYLILYLRCILNIKIDIVSIKYAITNNLFNSLSVRCILNIKIDIVSSTPSLTISYLILYLWDVHSTSKLTLYQLSTPSLTISYLILYLWDAYSTSKLTLYQLSTPSLTISYLILYLWDVTSTSKWHYIKYTITNNFLFNSLPVRCILNIKIDIVSIT